MRRMSEKARMKWLKEHENDYVAFSGNKIHCATGPAVTDGKKNEWWLDGKRLTKREWNRRVKNGQTKVTPLIIDDDFLLSMML